jgi:hypothetical protein
MNNLSLLTYTHSNAEDLHDAYFGRLKKYFPDLKNSYVTSNKEVKHTKCFLYDDAEKHSIQMTRALKQIPTDYVIYAQEDYILFDYVKVDELNKLIEYMEADKEIPFIRLIQSGLGNVTKKYNDDLAYLDSEWHYYFSTQITIWRKDILIKMYENADSEKLTDTEVNRVQSLRDISTNGLFHLKRGNQVGGHFNSYAYPYIATGVVKGKWNYTEYESELKDVFFEYDINPFDREIC